MDGTNSGLGKFEFKYAVNTFHDYYYYNLFIYFFTVKHQTIQLFKEFLEQSFHIYNKVEQQRR